MKILTITEAEIEKRLLEDKLYKLLSNFEADSGLTISSIDLNHARSLGTSKPTLIGMTVKVELL